MPARRIAGRIYEEIAVTATYDKPLPVDIGSATLSVTADGVEIKNDIGNPVPINDAGGSLTVDGPLTNAELRATPVPVDIGTGSLSVTVDGVEIKNDAGNPIPISDNGGSITVDGPLTNTELRATAVPVSGPLTDTQLRATAVPVSGPLTDAQLRATALPVTAITLPLPPGAATAARQDLLKGDTGNIDGKLPALSSGRIPVDGSGVTQPVSGPLTDTQLRATAVPVSGTVTSQVEARTPTTTSVASSVTSVTILPLGATRKGFSMSNVSASKLYLSFSGTAAVANSFIELPAGAFLLLDQQLIVTNAITGIWASANGTAQVTEYV